MEPFSRVPLLTSLNWDTWKFEIKVQLMHFDAWQFIEKSDAEPELAENGKTDTEAEKPAREQLTWREKQDLDLRRARAYTVIFQSLSDEFKPLVSCTVDGAEAWKILKDHFEPTTRARIIQLLDDFFNLKFVPEENLGLFLCRVKQAAERLRGVGHQLQSLYVGYQMIRSLPSEFQATVQAIYRWKDDDFVPSKIETELLLEENRLKLSQRDFGVVNTAFNGETRATPGKDKFSFTKNKVGPCFYCKKYGHIIANCKLKINAEKRKYSNSNLFETCSNGKCSNDNSKSNCNSCKSNFSNSAKSNVSSKINSNFHKGKSNVKGKHSRNSDYSEASHVECSKLNALNCTFSELDCNLSELSSELCEANSSDFGLENTWVFDTAATAHFCSNRNLYFDFEPVSDVKMSLAVGGRDCPVEGRGTIHFHINCKNGKYNQIILKNVLYNPKLRRNLLSGVKLEKQNAYFVGKNGKVLVFDKNDNELFYARRKGDLYFLKPSKYVTKCKGNDNPVNLTANQVDKIPVSQIWHDRFCHVNNEYVLNTSKNKSVHGLPMLTKLTEDCISCKLAKSKRVSFKPIGHIRSKSPLELLHLDLCGPLPVTSHGGSRYFLSIIDDFSRKVTVYTLKNKSDVFETFIRFQKRAERFLDKRVVTIRTDGGVGIL